MIISLLKNSACRFIFFLSIIFILTGCSGTNKDLIVRDWKILHLQNPSIENIAGEAEWEKVLFPGMFKLHYPPGKNFQYVWLKGEVHIENPEEHFGISLGRLYFVDRVFVNKRAVGHHTKEEMHEVHVPRFYAIPKNVLKKGKNIVHIYLGGYGREFCGTKAQIKLLNKDSFYHNKIFSNLLYRHIPFGIIFLFMGQAFISIFTSLRKKRNRLNLITMGLLFVWITYLLSFFSPWYPFSLDFRITYLWSSIPVAAILYFLFIQYYLQVFTPGVNKIYIPLLLLFSIVTISFQNTTSPWYPGRILGFLTIPLSTPFYSFLFIRAWKEASRRSLGMILLFVVIPGISTGVDIINYMFIYHNPPLLHVYVLPAMMTFYLIHRSREIMHDELQLKILYAQLRKIVTDNSSEPRDTSITESMSVKLEEAVAFLKANYRSDISREGLSRALDLSPDHMSRMFKKYTGMKISEYINHLRIEEAEKQLTEGDKKIIEIAFEVGFESLVTFNRAFQKKNSLTPSEYRQKKRLN